MTIQPVYKQTNQRAKVNQFITGFRQKTFNYVPLNVVWGLKSVNDQLSSSFPQDFSSSLLLFIYCFVFFVK